MKKEPSPAMKRAAKRKEKWSDTDAKLGNTVPKWTVNNNISDESGKNRGNQ